MNDFITYIVYFAVLNLYQGTLCKVNDYIFLELGSSMQSSTFIDSGNYNQNFFNVK